jgi:ankyrin repeat protein
MFKKIILSMLIASGTSSVVFAMEKEALDFGVFKPLLDCAAANGKGGIVKSLIKSLEGQPWKSDFIRSMNKQGNTALHLAVMNKHENVAEILLNAVQAPIEIAIFVAIMNQAGETALYWSAKKGSVKLVEMLLNAVQYSEKTSAIITAMNSALRIALLGYSIGRKCADNDLDIAAASDYINVIKVLLKYYDKFKIQIPQDLDSNLQAFGFLNN